MPRLRSTTTGVVVSVREGKSLLGFVPVEDEPQGGSEPDAGYSSQTVADLRAEIERRNEGREESDRIPADGKKADLVAALESDDGR